MQLEELKEIWETQAERPVFLMNDIGLHLALYQSRERARRRLFWGGYFINFVVSLLTLVGLLVMYVVFFFNELADGVLMNNWDDMAFLVALIAIAASALSMYTSCRKHEQGQSEFAPSLRKEIDRGIAQIDFEIYTDSSWSAWRNASLVALGTILGGWEFCRMMGDPRPWEVLWVVGGIVIVMFLALVPASQKAVKQGLRRKEVLEGLREKLDENPVESRNVADAD
jgi:hypothetical protein